MQCRFDEINANTLCIMAESQNQYIRLWEELKRYFRLQIDYTRLTAVEKVSLLLAAISVSLVMGLLCVCALFYLSFALAEVIGQWIGEEWVAYLILGGLFAVLMLIVYAFRKQLIINPVTRFVTRLFLDKK